ncbi:MAG: TlpA family protein disulfide reductase, partial [Rhodobacteraceae bacterium]|nr:TlpA family protein disulfide reductase [Paracoccaceae bacterium]
MRLIRSALLYISLALGANTAMADMSSIIALREGDMKKLNFHSEPKQVPQVVFTLEDDTGTATLADYQGKYILLNFWATWCAPCRAEMPMLAALQDEFGGDTFEVLTLATGRNSPNGIKKFFA